MQILEVDSGQDVYKVMRLMGRTGVLCGDICPKGVSLALRAGAGPESDALRPEVQRGLMVFMNILASQILYSVDISPSNSAIFSA